MVWNEFGQLISQVDDWTTVNRERRTENSEQEVPVLDELALVDGFDRYISF